MRARRIVWFSCGAASAVAAKICPDAEPVYCDTSANEHPDNKRFMRDVEAWIGRSVTVIGSKRFAAVEEVFSNRKYMAGIAGAPCTQELKKYPRQSYQRPDDRHVFGFTAGEEARAARLIENNPELLLDWPLIDAGITKRACMSLLSKAGIAVPVMYTLGFKNNNCIGCVKATSPRYWQMVREHFPEVFRMRAEQSRRIGARLVRFGGERRFLDEMPTEDRHLDLFEDHGEDLSCGPECASGAKP